MPTTWLSKNYSTHQRPIWHTVPKIALFVGLALLLVQGWTTPTTLWGQSPTAFVVNSTADTSDGVCDAANCTLREAIEGIAGPQTTISFELDTPATINLTAPLILSASAATDVEIVGVGVDQLRPELLTIDGGNTHRPLLIDDPNITSIAISGLTIANGQADNGGGIYTTQPLELTDVRLIDNAAIGNGGALYTDSDATLTNVTITGNSAANGGGVYIRAGLAAVAVTVADSKISNNAATGAADGNFSSGGGGVYIDGNGGGSPSQLTLTNSIIESNDATDSGGGVKNSAATVEIVSSTVEGNTAASGGGIANTSDSADASIPATAWLFYSTVSYNRADSGSGGGIFNINSALQAVNSTISTNYAFNQGGGIATDGGGAAATVELASVTLTKNESDLRGSGISVTSTSLSITNSILAQNDSNNESHDCWTDALAFTSVTYTLIGNETDCAGLFTGTGNIVGTAQPDNIDPMLGYLYDNGGPTQSHALLDYSLTSSALTINPARDAGDPAGCNLLLAPFNTDQRGFPRAKEEGFDSNTARCDMGAYEAGFGNDTWDRAIRLELIGEGVAAASVTKQTTSIAPTVELFADYRQSIDKPGQSRWYKFSVLPGSTVRAELVNLPANYDVTLYKDIDERYQALTAPQSLDDLTRLTAEFAPDSFAPDSFAPDSFAPDSFAPDSFAPDSFAPDSFAPDSFAPEAAYSSAQIRSLIGVSALDGLAEESITSDTWENSGDFYVRVRGRNGSFDPTAEYDLIVSQTIGTCESANLFQFPSTITPTSGDFETLILTDYSRMDDADPLLPSLQSKLVSFAARSEIKGAVVDVGTDGIIEEANQQADALYTCPSTKNLVANIIKEVVDGYKALNPNLKYIVIVGGDNVIPFYRLPDRALLANEKNFMPPVAQETSSYANLILGYILSQDPYGSTIELSVNNTTLPVPEMAVGRLVETPENIITMLDAYAATDAGTSGVMPAPQSALVTGYDFLEDAAQAVRTELETGLGSAADALIAPREFSPLSNDPSVWSADDLRAELLTDRHDMMFLAGHFSSGSALAADYNSRLLASEVADSAVDMENVLVVSPGCHAGYNVVNEHAIPNVTEEPDWPQTFAQKGATLIAGTGYQYGDTDILEYNERIYLAFHQQLLVGSGPVAIGDALVAAKVNYLAETPNLRGIHEKAILGTTLFGLPMLKIDMPFGRNTAAGPPNIVSGLTDAPAPGSELDLQYADVNVPFTLNEVTTPLTSVTDNSTVNATYYTGSDGASSNPLEPILPLEIRDVSVAGTVLRSVGFRGGSYVDQANRTPLTGAATTEIRGVHVPFRSEVFFPVTPWKANYFGAIGSGSDGTTRLNLTPTQFLSDGGASSAGTQRVWSEMDFRLFYSNNLTASAQGSASPTIANVTATSNGDNLEFNTIVTGDPAAGMQEVWVTYTICNPACNGTWQSLDLTQDLVDSVRWEGSLTLGGTDAADLLYIVQAANGVGLVSMNTNRGAYFTANMDPVDLTDSGIQPITTTLSLISPPISGRYNDELTLTLSLSTEGAEGSAPLADQRVGFALSGQQRSAVTDSSGQASVTIPLLANIGETTISVAFAGSTDYSASVASRLFTVLKQETQIVLSPENATLPADSTTTIAATLTDANGKRQREKSVIFIVSGNGQTYQFPAVTNFVGEAQLGAVPLPPDTYTVDAYFGGTIPLSGGSLTLDDDPNYLPATATGTITITDDSGGDSVFATCGDIDIIETAPGVYSAPDFAGNLIVGTDDGDLLDGTSGPDLILGLKGPDDIFGRGGDDLICGGRGVDIVKGQNGNDILYGDRGDDWLIGGNGQDTIFGGAGWDDLEGNDGQDELRGGSEYDVLLGGNGADSLFGNGGDDDLYGQKGNDALKGGNGDDMLQGGKGNDALNGGNGSDSCQGGSGNDTTVNCEGEVPPAAHTRALPNTPTENSDSEDALKEEAARRANDAGGLHAIEPRITDLFVPLLVR